MEFLYEYGIFLAKAVTTIVAIVIVVSVVLGLAMKQRMRDGQGKGELEINSLSESLKDIKEYAERMLVPDAQVKSFDKAKKAAQKAAKKANKRKQSKSKSTDDVKGRVFVVDFNGSMEASEVDFLRREITAIITVADKDNDQVLVRLESGGGVVHGYGLAASQLQRLKDKGIKLTVCVDKVAASGGYMMACVADKIVSAPFAIIGSIGVLAQLPNFNKLLKKNHVEIEQHTAGEYKRTLTMVGENTEEGRTKFKAELAEIHGMFKSFVSGNRPDLDIDKVATGEYWYGQQALDMGLVDALSTSDDILLSLIEEADVYSVKYSIKKNWMDKFGVAAETALSRSVSKVFQLSRTPFV